MARASIGKLNAQGIDTSLRVSIYAGINASINLARFLIIASLAVSAGACAGARDPNPALPRRTNEAPYPVMLSANAERSEQALAAWAALTRDQGLRNEPPPELQPVTATLRALPSAATADAPLHLPLVEITNERGEVRAESKEEAVRESLRRFITSASLLLGVAPANISLVERTDDANGTRHARYRQQPFPYPLRAGFGILEIAFTEDRRVLSLSSTAIPDTEGVRRALAALRPQQLTAEQAPERLRGRSFTLNDLNAPQTYTVATSDTITPRELVIYPVRSATDAAGALELHVAWELAVGSTATSAAASLVYLDAVTGEIIAAERPAAQPATQPIP